MDITRLAHSFLVAMPSMKDTTFAHTLIYICEHTEKGATGLILNRPLEIKLSNLFEKINDPIHNDALNNLSVFFGGPVMVERGFVLHRPLGQWKSSVQVSDNIAVTCSRDVLIEAKEEDVLENRLIVTLGCTSWGPGQLESELAANAWLNLPADNEIIFSTPVDKKLDAALAQYGIHFNQLSHVVGHA